MSKALIWLLVGFGLFFLILGILFGKGPLMVGLVLIGIAIFIAAGPDGVLRKEQVFDSWAILLENAQGKANEVLCDTERFVTDSKAPDVFMERKEIAPGMTGGFFGKRRDFLVVTDKVSFRLSPYKIFINSRDYGDNLDISWHLTYKPSILQAIASMLPYINIIPQKLSDLDLFDEQDLRVYATNVHHCLLKSVEKLMLSLNQDPAKIERKSRGFLGIS